MKQRTFFSNKFFRRFIAVWINSLFPIDKGPREYITNVKHVLKKT